LRPLTILATLVILITSSTGARGEDDIASNWTLRTPDGVSVELAERSQERPQIILFWATWCPYCKALMPHLQSIRLEYGDALGLLAVSIRADGNPEEFIANAGYDFTLLLDGDAVADEYQIVGTPSVIIVDTKRNIRFDLRQLPGLEMGPDGQEYTHRQRAKRLAPYWAAEIRKALDDI